MKISLNYRPVYLTSHFYGAMEMILNNDILNWRLQNQLITVILDAFTPTISSV